MIRRLSCKCLLRPEDVKPSSEELEVVGVFNPGAISVDGEVILLMRVAERPRETRSGYTALPRWDPSSGLVIDFARNSEITFVDPRVVMRKSDGLVRLTFISHLLQAHSSDGLRVDSIDADRFGPMSEYEEFGVEDPRITRIGERFYITYVAVSSHGAATALASTEDFKSYTRHGIVFCPENKDVVLFPEKIRSEYVALHRPNAATPFTAPEMWISYSKDLVHWGRHEHFLGSRAAWDVGRIGAGTPPVRVSDGWLEIYHGNKKTHVDSGVGTYSAGALLLDNEHPKRILRHSNGPIMVPERPFELQGFVPAVIFPTGVVSRDDSLLVYYGAADTVAAVVEFSLSELMRALN